MSTASFLGIFDRSFIRYLIVGVINTLAGLSAIFSIKYFAGTGDAAANLFGYLIGFAVSYTINSRWTFNYRGRALAGIIKFGIVVVVAYLCNLATVLGALHILNINSYLAQALGVPPYTLVGYLGGRLFAFNAETGRRRKLSNP